MEYTNNEIENFEDNNNIENNKKRKYSDNNETNKNIKKLVDLKDKLFNIIEDVETLNKNIIIKDNESLINLCTCPISGNYLIFNI